MADMLKTITQIEEKRSNLHSLLTKNEGISSGKPLTASRELDEIINQYYEDNKPTNSEAACIICNSKMYRKSG